MPKSNRVITVTKEFTFDAAHYLPGYDGQCANMHGHTYKLQVTLAKRADILNDGMVFDFVDLKSIVKEWIIDEVDHQLLNEVLEYRPTAENMVADFYDRIEAALIEMGDHAEDVSVVKTVLWETPTSFAECFEC
jgi:6-pyruvoyltetrahydropterin/6-carboxytetrahydropterin synthase